MKKVIYLLLALVLAAVVVVLKIYSGENNTSLNYFSEWGVYFFSVPIAYCIIAFFSNVKYSTTVFFILLGVVVTILLSRDLSNTLWVYKMFAAFFGALVIWLILFFFKSK